MRRKMTDAADTDDDLPELTSQQEQFVCHIISGRPACEAYRLAYHCDNMQQATIYARASELRHNSKVAVRIAAAYKAGLGHAIVTKEQHVRRLDSLKQLAMDSGNIGAAVQAEQLIGKVEGHYQERLEVTAGDPIDSLRSISAVLGPMVGPELAAQIAAQIAKAEGVEWSPEPATTTH